MGFQKNTSLNRQPDGRQAGKLSSEEPELFVRLLTTNHNKYLIT